MRGKRAIFYQLQIFTDCFFPLLSNISAINEAENSHRAQYNLSNLSEKKINERYPLRIVER